MRNSFLEAGALPSAEEDNISEVGCVKQMISETTKENLYFLLILGFVFSPFIAVLTGRFNVNQEITSPYLNGLITASGVLVGFLCASVISRAKDLDLLDFRLVTLALFIFIAAVLKLSFDLESGSSITLTDLLFIESSFIMSAFAAWGTMHTLFKKGHLDPP